MKTSSLLCGWGRILTLVVITALVSLAVSCGRKAEPPSAEEAVLATVESETITVAEFEEAMRTRGGGKPEVFQDVKNKKALLDEMITFEALALKAREEGYYDDPDIVAAVNRVVVGKYIQNRMQVDAAEFEVSDDEVREYYTAHRDTFVTPERVRAAVIEVAVPTHASGEKTAELRKKAEMIREKALAMEDPKGDFGPLAAEYSDGQATRYRGGDMGWLVKGNLKYRWEKPVLEAVYRLSERDEVSDVIEGRSGYYVVKLTDRQPMQVDSLKKVGGQIKSKLERDKRGAYGEYLAEEVKGVVRIEVDQQLLSSVPIPVRTIDASGEEPPGFPSGVRRQKDERQ